MCSGHDAFARPRPPAPAPVVDADPCTAPILDAERKLAIPPRLLLAIAMVESGRPNPRAGHATPWPWALNLAGDDLYAGSRQEAGQAVQAAQAKGIASIDVGCMQVNLQQHPTAFATIDEALDPVHNVAYAARFLVALHRETGDWATAVGYYHSHTQVLAEPYRTRVAAQLGTRELFAKDSFVKTVFDARAAMLQQMQAAWAASLTPAPESTTNTWYSWAQSVVEKTEPKPRLSASR